MALIKNNRNKGAKTVIRSVRMPMILDNRIQELAIKGLTTKSAWIIRTLTREANLSPKLRGSAKADIINIKPPVIDYSTSDRDKG